MTEVLAHKWATEGEEVLQQFYSEEILQKASPPSARKIYLTQASRGHASKAKASNEPLESKELFKLTKFKNVPRRLNTFREPPSACMDDDFQGRD
jgi:hypothetical protein